MSAGKAGLGKEESAGKTEPGNEENTGKVGLRKKRRAASENCPQCQIRCCEKEIRPFSGSDGAHFIVDADASGRIGGGRSHRFFYGNSGGYGMAHTVVEVGACLLYTSRCV